jgi:hypothetical protein
MPPNSVTARSANRARVRDIGGDGHGTPMSGPVLTEGLANLVANFDEIAVPKHGRYVPEDTDATVSN